MNKEIVRILDRQSGVISRRQARARAWRRTTSDDCSGGGNGQRSTTACMSTTPARCRGCSERGPPYSLAEPAALCHDSAIRAADGPGRRDRPDDEVIHVAIDRHRKLQLPAGIVAHRLVGLGQKVLWNAGPPRVRIEHAVLDVAAEAGDRLRRDRGHRQRRPVPTHHRAPTARRSGLTPAHRPPTIPGGVLDDVAAGTCSVLEHGYLTRVERAHGLPRAGRQVRASAVGRCSATSTTRRPACSSSCDGRLFHDTAAPGTRHRPAISTRRSTPADRPARVGPGFGRPCRPPDGSVGCSSTAAGAERPSHAPLCRGDLGATG